MLADPYRDERLRVTRHASSRRTNPLGPLRLGAAISQVATQLMRLPLNVQLPSLRSPSAITLYVNVANVAFGFITSVLLNRWLGPGGRGELAAAFAVAGLLPYIASTGLASSVLYHAAPNHEGPSRTLATALPIGVIQAATFGIAAWFLLPVLMGNQGTRVVVGAQIALVGLPGSLLALYLQGALQAQLRFGVFNGLRLVMPVGSLLGALALEATGRLSARSMVGVYIGLPFLAVTCSFAYMRLQRLVTSVRPQALVARRLLRYGWKAQIGDLANSLNVRLDQVLLAAWFPVEKLGLYVAALGASSLVSMLGYSVQLVLHPRLLNETNEANRSRLLKRAVLQYLTAGAAASLGLIIAIPVAIPRLFGTSFRGAVLSSQILIVAAVILGLKSILAGAAHAYGLPWLASKAELAGVIVTVLTLMALLPTFGIAGAAVSSMLAYSVQAAIIARGLQNRTEQEPKLEPGAADNLSR